MTDLTAAQLVERLKDTTAESWRWELAAATLIEQQTFLLAAMHEDRMRASLLIDLKANELAALRKVIEDAPHEGWCMTAAGGVYARMQGLPAECDCWKSKALPAQITT